MNFTQAHPNAHFSGPLDFLNSYRYVMGESYLTGIGASTEFAAGSSFWNRYGRILYNATLGQLAYNASFPDGSPRPKPVLRTTGQSRIENSQINWALGFFGQSFEVTPNPTLSGAGGPTAPYEVVIIPEGGTENNTLASYDSCFNDNLDAIGYLGDDDLFTYIPKYLTQATQRLQRYAPPSFKLNTNDTYAMQSICAYESNYLGLGMSSFCNLFTADEWSGFEQTLDIEYYYDYAWGNPTGRAQGIGYLQELLARLTNQYITSSNSSVNSTLDNNPTSFPLHQPFYADFSHDDIIISVLTALSLDYFRDAPSLTQVPPNPARRFILSHLTPFGGRLVTELVGCASPDPAPKPFRAQYSPGQYGYRKDNAPHKFIRLRVNDGILPIETLRGGQCKGRSDGLCALDKFLATQKDAYKLSNYDYAWSVLFLSSCPSFSLPFHRVVPDPSPAGGAFHVTSRRTQANVRVPPASPTTPSRTSPRARTTTAPSSRPRTRHTPGSEDGSEAKVRKAEAGEAWFMSVTTGDLLDVHEHSQWTLRLLHSSPVSRTRPRLVPRYHPTAPSCVVSTSSTNARIRRSSARALIRV